MCVLGKPVKDFSQSSLWGGDVKYIHTGGEIGANSRQDSATFTVQDQNNPAEVATPLVDLNITITPRDDAMPELILGGPLFVQVTSMILKLVMIIYDMSFGISSIGLRNNYE